MAQQGTYTAVQVREAAIAGADLVHDSLDVSEPYDDLINLVVNAIVTVLERPDATLDQVIESNYAEVPETVRGWISDGWDA